MKLSIIIPVFNERRTIEKTIRRVVTASVLGYNKEIIVIDDGSSDGTKELLAQLKKEFNFILLRHSKNAGKGAAVRTGIQKASGDYILIQDADLEYSPNDYPSLLRALKEDKVAIYGSRNLRPTRKSYFRYAVGVKFLTTLVNFLFHCQLTDIYTGYKLFPAVLMKSISLESNGFEIEAEVTAKILRSGYSIKEVPIHYYPRKFSEGKKIRFKDGVIGAWTILKYWLRGT